MVMSLLILTAENRGPHKNQNNGRLHGASSPFWIPTPGSTQYRGRHVGMTLADGNQPAFNKILLILSKYSLH